MNMPAPWWISLLVLLAMAFITWLVATARRNAGLVDIVWALFFLAATLVHVTAAPEFTVRAALVLVLVAAWSVRLSVYLAARNWGEPEDRRYQAIRRRNEPGFAWKSIYLVFGLQALLAWFVSSPLGAAIASPAPLHLLDLLGAALAIFGICFESIADRQLTRFKSKPDNAGRVCDSGLWRYTRHPNYFGECCVWWGFYLLAFAAGAWWTIFSPLLMTALLLKISGVALLEKDIAERRPGYQEYVMRTNAFIPGPPRDA